MSNIIWVAQMDTRNFSFKAMDVTKEGAVEALQRGLDVHRATFNLQPDWYDLKADVVCDCHRLGAAYREGMSKPLYTPEES